MCAWIFSARRGARAVGASALAVLLSTAGGLCRADDGFGGEGRPLTGLSALADGDSVSAADDPASSRSRSTSTAVSTPARQSVPMKDRSISYREAGVFENSLVVLPLLVADLEPVAPVTFRPMSGRSVGATPAAAWTRSLHTLHDSYGLR